MYFVTTKRAGYVLFSTTATERIAVGLRDGQQEVHLLVRAGGDWTVIRQWPVDEYSHTELMLAFGNVDEPADPSDVLSLVPSPRNLH